MSVKGPKGTSLARPCTSEKRPPPELSSLQQAGRSQVCISWAALPLQEVSRWSGPPRPLH